MAGGYQLFLECTLWSPHQREQLRIFQRRLFQSVRSGAIPRIYVMVSESQLQREDFPLELGVWNINVASARKGRQHSLAAVAMLNALLLHSPHRYEKY